MVRTFIVLLSLLFVVAGTATAATAQPLVTGTAMETTFELLPGAVVDRTFPAIYLMNPDGSIDAVHAASGELLWNSQAAARPLLVLGELLIAQAEPAGPGTLALVVLNRADGSQRQTLDVDLPKGVYGSVADRLGSSFRAWATGEGSQLLVGWENVRHRTSPLPPKKGEKMQSRTTGGARVDLAAKSFATLTTPPPRPTRPAPRLADDRGPAEKQFRAGEVLAQTLTVSAGNQDRLVLQRWQAGTGIALADVTLVEGPYYLRQPSVDGRHLLISRAAPPEAEAKYSFQVFSLETGQGLGAMDARRSYAFGFVLGNSFIYESLPFATREDEALVASPRQLRAVDLATGSALWERPLRDLTYRGPFPR